MLKHETSSSPVNTMSLENRLSRMAELLGLPVEVIQAHGKPQKHVTIRVARKKVGSVVEVEPQERLMTLRDSGPLEKEVAPSNTDKNVENELYERWDSASGAEKPELERKLFDAVQKRARNVMWRKIPDADTNLARDIASVVVERLGKFRQQSRFSTWAHRIILNQCNLHLRKKVTDRDRLYVSQNPEEDIKLKDSKAEAAFANVVLT